jgi:hypothetical protein
MIIIIFFLLALVLLKILFFTEINLDFIVIISSILVLLMVLYDPPKNQLVGTKERFTDITQEDINKIKYLNGLLVSTNTNQMLMNDQYKVPEIDTDSTLGISRDLKILISTYPNQSYTGLGGTLFNVAPNNKSGPDVICTSQGGIATKNFRFDEQEASFTDEKGLFLGNNSIKGPMSLNLGINGNGEFSIFIICNHDELSLGKLAVNMFRIYGNTPDNNGISLDIKDITTTPVQSGKLSLTFDAQNFVSDSVTLDPNLVYLYVIQKKPASIKLTVLSSISSTPVDIINKKLDSSDVLFSNKTMCINCYSNWFANLRAFGIYNVYLDSDGIKSLYTYMTTEQTKLSDDYKLYQTKLEELNSSLAKLKKCPYDPATCAKCQGVTDWTNTQNIIESGSNCRSAINTYCSTNSNLDICKCWNSNLSAYNTNECLSFRNIFTQNQDINIDSLDCKTVDAIKNSSVLKKNCVSSNVASQSNNDDTPGELLTVGIDPKKCHKPLPKPSCHTPIKPKPKPSCAKPINPTPAGHIISVPEKPSAGGFGSWLTSWFGSSLPEPTVSPN